jgi:hypothetical protein
VKLLLGGLACLFGAAFLSHEFSRLQQYAVRLHSKSAPEDAPSCVGGLVRGGNAKALRMLETLWVKKNGMKMFVVFALNISYIYVTGVLLQAWNCFLTSDGVSKLRNDPKTICTSASHIQFRHMATALIVVLGPGVPLGYVLWIRHLRAAASGNEHLLTRASWRGLSDPLTRASWGAPAPAPALHSVPVCHNLRD